jgi:hypothetical protein
MTTSARAESLDSPHAAPHSAIREGVIAGALGASVVAVWFLGVDVIAGHPLRTPELLGRALISVLGPAGGEGAFTYVAAYTVFHYAAFAFIGTLAALAIHWAEREPSILAGFLILFVVAEIGFYGLVGFLSEPDVLGGIAWYQVLIGNVLAAAVMGGYLWRMHPRLGHDLDQALSGRE